MLAAMRLASSGVSRLAAALRGLTVKLWDRRDVEINRARALL